MYLRIKEPHLARPYRTYIITPVTFCVVSPAGHLPITALTALVLSLAERIQVAAFLLLMPIFAAPLEAFAALRKLSPLPLSHKGEEIS